MTQNTPAKRLTISVSHTSSKADEIQQLAKIAKAIPAGTYLASLFTPQLVEWFSTQVHQDLPPSVTDHFRYLQEELARSVSERQDTINAMENHKRTLNTRIKTLEGMLQSAEAEIELKSQRIQHQADHLNQKIRRVVELEQQCQALNQTVKSLQAQEIALNDQILRIKAAAWDQMAGGAKIQSESQLLAKLLSAIYGQKDSLDLLQEDSEDADVINRLNYARSILNAILSASGVEPNSD